MSESLRGEKCDGVRRWQLAPGDNVIVGWHLLEHAHERSSHRASWDRHEAPENGAAIYAPVRPNGVNNLNLRPFRYHGCHYHLSRAVATPPDIAEFWMAWLWCPVAGIGIVCPPVDVMLLVVEEDSLQSFFFGPQRGNKVRYGLRPKSNGSASQCSPASH